ncbi:RcnB family protein [Aquabacterium sp. A08]|uniref:RcnB family protein n=1 Tax=Aquabacterium sp. A08 TaxID=2718532 RepID=UPI0014221960|nr:RcnB family protein [Aquabacterium sp. A08]NIC41901.1 RcnB family protein [Aquabacterium sp. A08]
MTNTATPWVRAVLTCSAVWLVTGSAWAGKPDWVASDRTPGHGKVHAQVPHDGPDHRDRSGLSGTVQIGGPSLGVSIRFGDEQRRAVRDYYAPRVQAGKCPPGLAKKQNGCRPPGLAKAWHLGQPLPSGVVVYPVPRELERRLGTPPAGHKFVRVAADILLIAVGTSLVVDAIEDLAGL